MRNGKISIALIGAGRAEYEEDCQPMLEGSLQFLRIFSLL